jgi:hypothetical protein
MHLEAMYLVQCYVWYAEYIVCELLFVSETET